MSKSKKKNNKKRHHNQHNIQKIDNQSMNKKPEIQKTYSNDGKKTWVKIIVLFIACAMIIGIIAMPLMSIYN